MKDLFLKIMAFVIGGAIGLALAMNTGSARRTKAAEQTNTLKPFDVEDFEADPDHASSHSETIQKYRFNAGESEMLQRAAIAEAGYTDPKAMCLVMRTVLNRVEDESGNFPDTIEAVLFQKVEGVFQFSCVAEGGKFWQVKPNEASEEALERLALGEDESRGALFFHAESCGSNWVSRNREYLFTYSGQVFYQ